MDIKNLTDEQLEMTRVQIIQEQEDRRMQSEIPGIIEDITARFLSRGGAETSITAAIARAKARRR